MIRLVVALLIVLVSLKADASLTSVGPNGINSANLPYDGTGILIGQLEYERPGDPDLDDAAHSNATTDPEAVFIEYNVRAPIANNDDEIIDPNPAFGAHATRVAGVMISSDPVTKGVAPGAELYATAGDVTTSRFQFWKS